MEAIGFERLSELATQLHDDFRVAAPFPHVVIDDFLPVRVAEALAKEFTQIDEESWKHYHHYNERKLAITDYDRLPPTAQWVAESLRSAHAIDVMTKLSGIEGLISDPSFEGAGMHMVRPGGFLNIHTDFLAHTKQRNWSRHINLIIYFNEDWQEAWNGNLEFWDADVNECVQSIPPLFNRCVIFQTIEKSYHGHPNKLSCPPGMSRKSLLFYYYRDDGHELELSSTNYQPLPGDSRTKRLLIAADRILLRLYTFVKARTTISDRLMDRILRLF
ncbi:MAG: 2OG-Fe(II) oxygenase [Myxococcota bacterium]